MRNQITLTDAEIEHAFDELGCCLDIENVTFTRDTLDDFRAARSSWSKSGRAIVDTAAALVIDGAQTRVGEPRKTVYVIDLGAARAVYA